MRVLVTGSRDWYTPELAEVVLSRLIARHGPWLVIVHGDCPAGIDRSFREACEELGIEQEPHPAQWDPLGPAGGPIRNAEMVRAGAELCLVFARDLATSDGTADCARRALGAAIPTWLVDNEEARPVRLSSDDPRLT